jgi:hypothetical protein
MRRLAAVVGDTRTLMGMRKCQGAISNVPGAEGEAEGPVLSIAVAVTPWRLIV